PGEAIFDSDVLTLDKACVFQTLTERGEELWGVVGRPGGEDPDHRHRRLLRACRERPRRRRAADERDELAPSNVTCHAPLPRRHAQSNNITSLFDHSRSVARWPRYVRLAFDIRSISRVVEEIPSALIGRRDAAQAQSATSAINRAGAAQDIHRFRPQPFAG